MHFYPETVHQPCLLSPLSMLWLVGHCRPISNVLFTILKTMNPASELTSMAATPQQRTEQKRK
jgi:hypothetical protein